MEEGKNFRWVDTPILFGLTPYSDLQHQRDGIDKWRDAPLLQAVK